MKKGDKFKKDSGKQYRVNGRIRAREVRVIGPEGQQLGIFPIREAQTKASEYGLDLVEMAPHARPPVCRIVDFGKMRYDASKKQKQLKKKSNQQTTKTVKMKPNIGEHDLNRKIADVQKFIDKGYRVVVQLSVKGRQRKFMQLAQDQTIFKVQGGLVAAIMEKPQAQGYQVTATFTKDLAEAAKIETAAAAAAREVASVEGATEGA